MGGATTTMGRCHKKSDLEEVVREGATNTRGRGHGRSDDHKRTRSLGESSTQEVEAVRGKNKHKRTRPWQGRQTHEDEALAGATNTRGPGHGRSDKHTRTRP
ncbi:hypothetical protein ElyMa_003794900 [Elysia marginata]|uniref:Uncharacterized protein n=1 Tax=Elysia marginata TaxID=1093978 RepID=A0AAV4FCI1_9GAST|nr:hypothetical protein ElyMa_003794900 [Elysia marginata]